MRTYRLGVAAEDAEILIDGFGMPARFRNIPCRWASTEARLRAPEGARSIVLVAGTEFEQEIELRAGGKSLGKALVSEGDYTRARFELFAGARELVLRCRENPNNTSFDYRDLAVAEVRFEGAEPLAPAERASGVRYDGEEELIRLSRPFEGMRLFWGDLHIHSNASLCDRPFQGSPEENVVHARDACKLDFCSLTDHAEHIKEEGWEKTKELAREYTTSSFVVVPAYEWTSSYYGHRNVYSSDGKAPLVRAHARTGDTPEKLFCALRESRDVENVVVVPHHTSKRMFPANLIPHDPELERSFEIYSKWGSSEYWGNDLQETSGSYAAHPGLFYADTLAAGRKWGVVGGCDGHVIAAGARGLAGVFARELTADALVRAIRARRTFATTGTRSRILISLNDRYFLGDVVAPGRYELEAMQPLRVYVELAADSPVERLELVENNAVVHAQTVSTAGGYYALRFAREFGEVDSFRHFAFEYVSPPLKKPYFPRFFYARATLANRHAVWSSPVWVVPRLD